MDISAPQIIFVEQFTDPNSAMAVIDFGRLQLQNVQERSEVMGIPVLLTKESEEDGMHNFLFLFMGNFAIHFYKI